MIVNTSLILVFLVAILIFYNFEVSCYYKEKYNVICKTCGFTRDFKSILKLDFDALINPLSVYYFSFLVLFSFMRISTSFLLIKKVEAKIILTSDIAISMIALILIGLYFNF